MCIAAVLYTNCVVGFIPLASVRELTPAEHLLMHIRRILLLLLLLLFPGFPLCLWFLAANATGDITAANNVVDIVVISQAGRMWGLMAGFAAGRTAEQDRFPALPVPALLILVHIQAGIATGRPGVRYPHRG